MRHMNRVLVGHDARGRQRNALAWRASAALLEGRPRSDAGPTAPGPWAVPGRRRLRRRGGHAPEPRAERTRNWTNVRCCNSPLETVLFRPEGAQAHVGATAARAVKGFTTRAAVVRLDDSGRDVPAAGASVASAPHSMQRRAGTAHQRRRDRGRRAAGAAPGAGPVPAVQLAVIAPDGNRSAMARSITTRRPLWVQEVDFDDGTVGYATDGTPVDCVRLARLGLIEGFEAELVVSGINHGSNLGDDITYSGTVAAALEAIVLGLPGIAVSQQSSSLELDFRAGSGFDFTVAATFTARLVAELEDVPLPAGHAAQHQRSRRRARGRGGGQARQADLSRRARAGRRGRRRPAAVPDLRGRQLRARRDRHRPRRGGGRPDRGHPDPLRPHRPRRARCARSATTWRG